MTKDEAARLFRLAKELWPTAAKQIDSRDRTAAWLLAFEDESYEDVRKALLLLGRTQRYFPDVQEIAAALPDREPETAVDDTAPADEWRLEEDYHRLSQLLARMIGYPPCPEGASSEEKTAWGREVSRAARVKRQREWGIYARKERQSNGVEREGPCGL